MYDDLYISTHAYKRLLQRSRLTSAEMLHKLEASECVFLATRDREYPGSIIKQHYVWDEKSRSVLRVPVSEDGVIITIIKLHDGIADPQRAPHLQCLVGYRGRGHTAYFADQECGLIQLKIRVYFKIKSHEPEQLPVQLSKLTTTTSHSEAVQIGYVGMVGLLHDKEFMRKALLHGISVLPVTVPARDLIVTVVSTQYTYEIPFDFFLEFVDGLYEEAPLSP